MLVHLFQVGADDLELSDAAVGEDFVAETGDVGAERGEGKRLDGEAGAARHGRHVAEGGLAAEEVKAVARGLRRKEKSWIDMLNIKRPYECSLGRQLVLECYLSLRTNLNPMAC